MDSTTPESHWQLHGPEDPSTLGHCLHHLIEQAVERHGGKTAVVCAGVALTHGELNSLANRLASVLVQRGIKPGDPVGVALERSVDLVVVLLAVLKAGGACVPIEPSYPAARISHILDNSAPKLLIASPDVTRSLEFAPEACLDVVGVKQQINSVPDGGNLTVEVRPSDLAYIIYTSGSTGRPKGVAMSHEGLCNLLLSIQRDPGCDETDRVLAISPVCFDMSVPDLFLPLICGGRTVIAEKHEVRDPDALLRLMERFSITMMTATPTTWQMLLDSGWRGQPRLRRILLGGEALPKQLAQQLLSYGDQVVNGYGPTETIVYASTWSVIPNEDIVVGLPPLNVRVYLLDGDMAPVPLGSTGEIFIGGSGVSLGYHRNPELTQSRFIRNPFHPGRLYRSGDVARLLAPGKLCILGRSDHQVKIRGNRVELSEIESALVEHPLVMRAVVIYRDRQLVAYYLEEEDSGRSATEASHRDLRSWVTERLPQYMVPAFFVKLSGFPMTPNGKLDREALPDPAATTHVGAGKRPPPGLERQLWDVWSSILGHDDFSTEDSFFEIGGDSARLVRVKKALQGLGYPVSVALLFQHYTLKALAAALGNSRAQETIPEPASDPRPPPLGHDEDIAIISMACRLPGGITTPQDFWTLLESSGEVVVDVPPERWDAAALYDADPDAVGKSYCSRGGFLDGIDAFDSDFFNISPREAQAMNPAQRLLLETCWEAFERAGYTGDTLGGSPTGVFIGASNIPAIQQATPLDELGGYSITGSTDSALSGRLSYALGLEGPSLTLDTACSSSLVATHAACTALRRGECDMAVAGGVSLMLTPGLHVEFSRLRAMSADGRCRALSADADGTGWSEGAALVVCKRLSDAQRDGDTIHAVIRGTAVNHGGRSAGFTTPSGPAQQRVIHAALAASNLQPGDIDYIEAHGTATPLGDPIEGSALADVFRGSRSPEAEPLWVGSAKSNLGHTQAAAGVVGLLKTVLAMQHGVIPETLHITKPHGEIDWAGANMAPAQMPQPWRQQSNRRRRAGISAFGVSGTNAHIIVEEPPPPAVLDTSGLPQLSTTATGMALPVLLSAPTEAALRRQAEQLRCYIESGGGAGTEGTTLQDIASSLATTRTHFRRRLVLRATDKTQLLAGLASLPAGSIASPPGAIEAPCLAVLFTGQGSQWAGMGQDIAHQQPVFRQSLLEVAAHFEHDLDQPLLEVMWARQGSERSSLLQRTDYAQAAQFALQVALWRLWTSWGVRANLILGHSSGELAAAHAAGVLNLADACRLVAVRGRLMQAVPEHGVMASLEAGADEVDAVIEALQVAGKIAVAAWNAPTQTVVSGDSEAVVAMVAHFAAQGRKAKMLETSHAFHSHHMDAIMVALQEAAAEARFSPPTITFVSSLTGSQVDDGQLSQPSYWAQQARRPVKWMAGLETLLSLGANVFLEMGPRPVLCGLGAACVADKPKLAAVPWLPSLLPGQDGGLVMQDSLARLHVRQVRVDWASYFGPGAGPRIELPTYPFQRQQIRKPLRSPRDVGIERTAAGASDEPQNTLGRTSDKQPAQRVDECTFAVDWVLKATQATPGASATLGLLFPTGEAPWFQKAQSVLLSAGLRFVRVSCLDEARDLDGLLCLWHADAEMLEQAHEMTRCALAQLQDAARIEHPPPVVWITRQAVGVSVGDAVLGLSAAPLWGLMRSARSEHPHLCLRLVDIDGDDPGEALARGLALADEPECVVRDAQVLVPRMRRAGPRPAPPRQRDGAVLITGGLGGIGQQVARWLVAVHGVRDLVLSSRRGMAAPGAEALVSELTRAGAAVTIMAGDVGDAADVDALISPFRDGRRPLRGVIHAAGIVDDAVITALTAERCQNVFRSKAAGAWHLHRLTETMNLEFFVLFSSVAGIMGTPGQGNYAAANTFLDALAHLRHAQNLPATSVAWGMWGGAGMVANMNHAGRQVLARSGFVPLTLPTSLALLADALHTERALAMAVAYDLDQLSRYHEATAGRPPPLLQDLLASGRSSEAAGEVEKGTWGPPMEPESPAAFPGHRAGPMLDTVRAIVAEVLMYPSPEDVDVSIPLQQVGIDSLTSIMLRNRLADLTSLPLSIRSVLEQPSLTALSQLLLNSGDSSSQTSSQDGTPPSSIDSVPSLLDVDAIRQGCLDPSLAFDNIGPQDATKCPGAVFVTGATGFVGAFIVHELLRLGIAAHCLVRAADLDEGRTRLTGVLTSYSLWESQYASLLHPVVGDLEKPFLGLTPETFGQLADQVDAICHSGALVHWTLPLERFISPNMVSTHEVLRLASTGRGKVFHCISTASTLPLHVGYKLTEGENEYGYATSKYFAERMVAAARWRGAEACVYRLPFVTASAATGHFRRDRGDFLHNLVSGSLEMGCFPSIGARLDAVLPVDYLARTIVSIMTGAGPSWIGRDVDFAHGQAPSFDEFFAMAAAAAGKDMPTVPVAQWRRRALARGAAESRGPLARIAPLVDGLTDEGVSKMFKAAVLGKHVLGGDQYPAPCISPDSVRKYVERIQTAPRDVGVVDRNGGSR